MDDDEFDLLTLDEVADRLARRYDGLLIAYVSGRGDGKEHIETLWRVGCVMALGLATNAREEALAHLSQTRLPEDGA